MLLKIVYLLTCRVLALAVLAFLSDRAKDALREHSQVGKILEIHHELPGRIHVVLIRQQVCF